MLAVGGVNYLAGDFREPPRAAPPCARRDAQCWSRQARRRGRQQFRATGHRRGDRCRLRFAEAKAIRDLFGKVTHGRAELLNDKDATKDDAWLLRCLATVDLHLATHGYFAGAEVNFSPSPRLTIETVRSAFETLGPVGGRGPLPRPALRLGVGRRNAPRRTRPPICPTPAGHDRRGGRRGRPQGLRTDGPLRLPDRIGVAGGQGVQGLQQAFHTAGVRTVIGSLWRVDDAATAVLMEEFYTNLWQMKLPKLEAFRQAQLTILHHPERVEQRRQFLASTERALGKVSRPLPKADGKAPMAAANRRGGPPSSSAATFAEHHEAHAPSRAMRQRRPRRQRRLVR